LKAEKEGGFVQFDRAMLQVMSGEFVPGVLHEALEGNSSSGQSPL
jgi:hypothetical protein